MTNGIVTKFAGTFDSLDEALRWGKMVSISEFCPVTYKNKPIECVLAAQYGHEVGLKPLQALQGVKIINGNPSVYGDTMLALCRASPHWEDIKEEFLTSDQLFSKYGIKSDYTGVAGVCRIKRKGEEALVEWFSEKDALEAGLLNRAGPWKTYKRRMLKMRARGFALRDKYADVLKGIISSEEAQDYITTEYETIPEPDTQNQIEIDQQTGEILIIKDEPLNLITQEMIEEINSLIIKENITEEQIKKWTNKMEVQNINELTVEKAEKLISYLLQKSTKE